MFTELEWQILKSVWQGQPTTSRDIVRDLSDKTDSSAATIKTVLHRLVDKNAIGFRRKGNRYLYSARHSPARLVGQACNDLVRIVFDGQPAAAMTYLLSSSSLPQDQLNYLRELLVELQDASQHSARRESEQQTSIQPMKTITV